MLFTKPLKLRQYHADVSLTDVSPNEKSRMFRPLDNASLRRRIPWTESPWKDASLGRSVLDRYFRAVQETGRNDIVPLRLLVAHQRAYSTSGKAHQSIMYQLVSYFKLYIIDLVPEAIVLKAC
jgi:hypothetical protein